MTVEIAILNKQAVALAADSMVTVGSKTFETANKLFTLSKCHPVGVMIYGNAEFMGVPWETLIKQYREDLGRRSFRSVATHADHFIDWTMATGFFGAEENQREHVKATIAEGVAHLRRTLTKSVQQSPVADMKELRKRFRGIVETHVDLLKKETPIGFAPRFTERAARRKYVDEIDGALSPVSGLLTKVARDKAEEFCACLLTRRLSRLSTGLVVAGFGSDELFPTLVDYRLDGVIADHLKYERGTEWDVSRGGVECGVKPFAQPGMVSRFMNGIDPQYEDFLTGLYVGSLKEVAEAVASAVASTPLSRSQKRTLEAEVLRKARDVLEAAEKEKRRLFVDQILDIVMNLPKEELAKMAESLVSLTSLKQRVSPDQESVGGPVDVAVISKGDGFVWIKRKHYFPAELNNPFFDKYFDCVTT